MQRVLHGVLHVRRILLLACSAETACYTCGEFLCADCEEKHSQLKATRDHSTCPLGELMASDNLVRFQRQRFDACAEHAELMKLYCKRCKVALCNVCVYDNDHQQHDVTSIHNKVMTGEWRPCRCGCYMCVSFGC